MAHRTLEINLISAKGLKNVNLIDKMDVYCIISLKGGSSKQKTRTPVDKDCGKNPNWNFPVKFTVDESLAKKNNLNVKFKIMCERILGDKELGKVNVPVKELLDSPGDGGSMKFVSFQVRKPSGRAEGSLDFSYRLGEAVAAPVKPEKNKGGGDYHQPFNAYPPGHTAAPVKPEKNKGGDDHYQPVTAYPAGHMAAGSSSGVPYGAPGGYPPPPQAGYGYPPPPHVAAGYGGYPPQGVPPPGYGYPPPPQQPGYGYPPPGGYGYPPVQQPPKKNSKFGLGLGAGLVGGAIGGLLIGDMVSDAADYDGGFDGGFDF
ncbi:hypothetical protein V6N13_060858 [Hibiscus sabdariffa]|uniref:Uncharacterized protein n=2 Tax=Hibiscus sabdariffa TaxID=183260 RepID=A0ABR2P6G7_9ROSI